MNTYSITPLDPLVFGDGRPFSTEAGAQVAGGQLVPMPGVLAGAVRTASGRQKGGEKPTPEFWMQSLEEEVHGPLVSFDERLYLAAPSNLVVMDDKGKAVITRSLPMDMPDGYCCDLPVGLRPCLLPESVKDLEPSKKDGPRLLSISDYRAFFAGKEFQRDLDDESPWDNSKTAKKGSPKIEAVTRAHVGLEFGTLASKEGQLYVTKGAEYGTGVHLEFRTSISLGGDALTLGGERRLAGLSARDEALWQCPFRGELENATKVAMVLATPAFFTDGWRPTAFLAKIGAKLVGAVCRRREFVSGWDMATDGPKAVRWLAPAGSVYFLEIPEGQGKELAEHWLQSISEDEQMMRDGYGLAAFFPTEF